MPARSARSRALPALLALLGVGLAGARYVNAGASQIAAPAAIPERSSLAPSDLLTSYCVTCHNGRLNTAGLQLDGLSADHVADNAAQWEKIVTKLRTGEVPPPGRPRPDAAAYRAVVAALESRLDAAAAARPHPGRVPVHRLNRREY